MIVDNKIILFKLSSRTLTLLHKENPVFCISRFKGCTKNTSPKILKDSRERTTLEIICDTKGLPIYVDGHLVGYSPLKIQ